MTWVVDYVQACEPELLERVAGISVEVVEERDSMGHPRVAVYGETREAVIDYVRDQWGDDDPDWFSEYVVARVRVVGAG